jgi:DNA-directed RNA polymerase subunit beta
MEKVHEKNVADLMEVLLDKLQTLLKDKPLQVLATTSVK